MIFLCVFNLNFSQAYKNFVLANEYKSSRLCERLYSGCDDKMDQLQSQRLPTLAKFDAGLLQCNQSFQMECIGPHKVDYDQKLSKVRTVTPMYL